jgi:hypothetical protein
MVRVLSRWMSVASHLCAQTKECPSHNRARMTKGGGDGTRTITVDVCGFTPLRTDKGVARLT